MLLKRKTYNFSAIIQVLLMYSGLLMGQPAGEEPIIYLFPGQGSDERMFKNIDFPYDTIHIKYPVPPKKTSLREYAYGFIPMIDTNRNFILIGVSLGGMICSELADTLKPVKVILISSAKYRGELPGRYTFQKTIPLVAIVPGGLMKWGALRLQPLVEPDSKNERETCKNMLGSKDKKYLKRTVNMIINWPKTEYDTTMVHIHGDKDHTLPIKHISYDFMVPDGSHMMTLTRGTDISQIINEILEGEL